MKSDKTGRFSMPTSAMHSPVLSIQGLEAGYGKAQILFGVDLEVHQGEVVALFGANGAGKTTLLNTISGFVRPTSGRILLENTEIGGLKPHQTFRRGVIQVSQERDLFPDLSVEDNLRLGAPPRNGKSVDEKLQNVYHSFPRLGERRSQHTRTLSGGEQQMVALGRAAMGQPKVLLLDEPSSGLAPQFVNEIGAITAALKENGSTMLLVEQNFGLAMKVADRVMILRDGKIIEDSRTDAITHTHEELVQRVYL